VFIFALQNYSVEIGHAPAWEPFSGHSPFLFFWLEGPLGFVPMTGPAANELR
jgi:hypothetical protein